MTLIYAFLVKDAMFPSSLCSALQSMCFLSYCVRKLLEFRVLAVPGVPHRGHMVGRTHVTWNHNCQALLWAPAATPV